MLRNKIIGSVYQSTKPRLGIPLLSLSVAFLLGYFMKKTGNNLIPQKIIEGKTLTVQGKPEIFILINEFLDKYDDKKINKIVFLGGSRQDLRIIFQYMFSKRIFKDSLLSKYETHIYREVNCSTETSEKLWPQLAINWVRTKGFLLDFFSFYHNKLKDDEYFPGTDSQEWTKLRKYFSKHYLDLIDFISNTQELYSDSKIIFNGVQRFEMCGIKDNVARDHKSILERYKYKATTDVYYRLIQAIYYIEKNECLLLWNMRRENEQLLFNLILGLDNVHTMPSTHKILSSINIQQRLTSAPNLLIVQFKNADKFNKMPKQIKNILQEFEVIDLGPRKTKTAQAKTNELTGNSGERKGYKDNPEYMKILNDTLKGKHKNLLKENKKTYQIHHYTLNTCISDVITAMEKEGLTRKKYNKTTRRDELIYGPFAIRKHIQDHKIWGKMMVIKKKLSKT